MRICDNQLDIYGNGCETFSTAMQRVIMLSIIMLGIIMLRIIMLSNVMPQQQNCYVDYLYAE